MQIIKDCLPIDSILSEYQNSLKADFDRYRNHVFRVFNFAVYLTDKKEKNQEKFAIALAFHDLGIWTHNTFDYIDPSVQLAKEYLDRENKNEWVEEISIMIDMHHKITAYNGIYLESVEIMRMADLIDVSLGVYKFNIPKEFIVAVKNEFPNLGFHSKLIQLGLGNFFQSPFNPLPMFKK